jgi:hypothetical protein
MPVILVLEILNALLALIEPTSPAQPLVAGLASRLTQVHASGADISDADKAVIDQAVASRLLVAKGYSSLTAALLQAPAAPATTVA